MLDPGIRIKKHNRAHTWFLSSWSSEVSWRNKHVAFSEISNTIGCGKKNSESLINQGPFRRYYSLSLALKCQLPEWKCRGQTSFWEAVQQVQTGRTQKAQGYLRNVQQLECRAHVIECEMGLQTWAGERTYNGMETERF